MNILIAFRLTLPLLIFYLSITVIQIYASATNAGEAEVDQFYEDLEDLLELMPKKNVLFIIRDSVQFSHLVVSDSL